MFEARLVQGKLLKQLASAVMELVAEANWDISSAGISMQAMDTSHVCLVSFLLRSDGFDPFRCDRNRSLGISLKSLVKVLKCAGSDDIISLRAQDDSDTIALLFESPDQNRIADFELKLMEIDSEHLGIPDNEYSAQVKMPSKEFDRLVHDLGSIGEQVTVSVTKDGVKFSAAGDIGTANVTLRHSTAADKEGNKIIIDMNEPVALNFSLKYLVSFSKACSLAPSVVITLIKDLPMMVEFQLSDFGYIRYYLAPKIEEEEAPDMEQ